MSFAFKKIKADMTPKEAAAQYDQLLKLEYDENGNYSEECGLDVLRVMEALGTGKMPTRAQVRERVKANELAFAGQTDAEACERYAATLRRPH
jgi:hypothetical protein